MKKSFCLLKGNKENYKPNYRLKKLMIRAFILSQKWINTWVKQVRHNI